MANTDQSNSIEGLKLIADWSRWLIAIETGAISVIGAVFLAQPIEAPLIAKVFATGVVLCFLVSVASAAFLLLSLPEIASRIEPDASIWLTRDSVIGRLLHLNTEQFATIESFFFGAGMILFSGLVIALIWMPASI